MFSKLLLTLKEQLAGSKLFVVSMFSWKKEELIRRLKRAQFASKKVEIFKPQVDTRLQWRNGRFPWCQANEIRSTPVPAAANIRLLADGCDVVGIDEGSFFDDEIVNDM